MRFIGLDVHRDFCEVAIAEEGAVRSAGRVKTTPEALALFAGSLAVDDEVTLEATGNALAIARIIEPYVGRVVLANPKAVHASATSALKTDKVDARTLARLLAGGLLPEVWLPDERARRRRRLISRRAQLSADSPGSITPAGNSMIPLPAAWRYWWMNQISPFSSTGTIKTAGG